MLETNSWARAMEDNLSFELAQSIYYEFGADEQPNKEDFATNRLTGKRHRALP